MRIKKDAVLREIAGEYVLIPMDTDSGESTGLYVLSNVAKRIWELLSKQNSQESILNTLYEEYDVDRESLCNDLKAFLAALQKLGMVD